MSAVAFAVKQNQSVHWMAGKKPRMLHDLSIPNYVSAVNAACPTSRDSKHACEPHINNVCSGFRRTARSICTLDGRKKVPYVARLVNFAACPTSRDSKLTCSKFIGSKKSPMATGNEALPKHVGWTLEMLSSACVLCTSRVPFRSSTPMPLQGVPVLEAGCRQQKNVA